MRRVFYLMSGKAHLPYLCASLYSLRKHWDGEIAVYAWPESYPIVLKMSQDRRLGILPVKREPKYRGRCDQFIDKIAIAIELPIEHVYIYLDADTTVHGSLVTLFDAAEIYGFATTQFNEWTTLGRTINGRLGELARIPMISPGVLQYVMSHDLPSVNGGVWACRSTSGLLSIWHKLTMASRELFIADEKVLHLIAHNPDWQDQVTTLRGGRWNCSPIYQPKNLRDEDVIIRHYHGDANSRPTKSQRGCDLWNPIYYECWKKDVGSIRDWIGEAGNKYLQIPNLQTVYS